MDVVYLLGDGSKHDDVELRWSLRSIARHGRQLGKVIVVGKDPGWLDPKTTIHIPYEEPKGVTKHKNMMAKVLKVIDLGVTGPHFLLSSDDHIYTSDVDFDDYPIYLNGELPSASDYDDVKITKYRRSILDTRQILEEFGYPTLCFHAHVNTHILAACVDDVKEMLAVEPGARYGYEVTDMFMNVYASYGDLDTVYRPDIKFAEFPGEDEMVEKLLWHDCFSFSDYTFDKDGRFEAFMNARFGRPCRFELG